MRFGDVIEQALSHLRQHRLRTAITVAIIALGIMALIGIITAIEAMNQKLMESFSTMGASGFTIRYKERNLFSGTEKENRVVENRQVLKQRRSQLEQRIDLSEAIQFKSSYGYPATVSIASFAGNRHEVTAVSGKADASGVYLFGADENYLELNGISLAEGRNFSPAEISQASAVAIIGADVAEKVFGSRISPLNKMIRVDDQYCRVIGVLASRGSTFGFSRDNIVVTGYRYLVRRFDERSFTIAVKADAITNVGVAMDEAISSFRSIRKLLPTDANNFVVDQSNSLADRAMNSLKLLTMSVTIIGLITLTGAAIGLMNILLVAVAERTREIGLLKAIGSKPATIRQHFFVESVLLSICGAFAGVVLGVAVGNIFSLLLNTSFVVPWLWIGYGVLICFVVGLLSGIYPAIKAGRLNPIEALRYE